MILFWEGRRRSILYLSCLLLIRYIYKVLTKDAILKWPNDQLENAIYIMVTIFLFFESIITTFWFRINKFTSTREEKHQSTEKKRRQLYFTLLFIP